jgi:Ca2+-binding RTX toxin-like protein
VPLPSSVSAKRAKLQINALEDRTVPTVTAAFAGGALTITGDAVGNNISVQVVSGQIKAFDGATDLLPTTTITTKALKSIVVNADDGSDTVLIDAPIKVPTTLNGGLGDDLLFGGLGADLINAGDGANSVEGRDGNDTITGGIDSDALYGGRGSDRIDGGDGPDLIFGGGGAGVGTDKLADNLTGGAGDDSIFGNQGNDTVDAGTGNDLVEGDLGNDTITAGPAQDPGVGVPDEDLVYGGSGNDTILGGWGLDAVYGEAGLDVLVGGAGNDTLSGGLGRDVFQGYVRVGDTAPLVDPYDADNFDTYKDEFDFTKPIFGKPSALAIMATELDISDTLSALTAIVDNPSNFNIAGRIRYLGAGEFLVKVGDVNGFDWVPVSFDGTWTDNDALPNAQERFLKPTAASEKREFWPLLFHRARMAGKGTFTFDTHVSQVDYDTLSVNPGLAVEELSGKPQDVASPFTFVGTTPPPNFGFTDIQGLLNSFRWLTVRTVAAPTNISLLSNQAYAITGAFSFRGTNYIQLYHTYGYDSATPNGGTQDPGTAAQKNDGFITISVANFFNDANFATAWVN